MKDELEPSLLCYQKILDKLPHDKIYYNPFTTHNYIEQCNLKVGTEEKFDIILCGVSNKDRLIKVMSYNKPFIIMMPITMCMSSVFINTYDKNLSIIVPKKRLIYVDKDGDKQNNNYISVYAVNNIEGVFKGTLDFI